MKFDVFYTARAPQWSPNKTKIWQPQVPLVCQPCSENQFLYWLAFKNGADSVWHGPCRILLLWGWRLYTVLLLWRRTEELGGRGRSLGKWSLVWEGLKMEVEISYICEGGNIRKRLIERLNCLYWKNQDWESKKLY